MLEGNNRKRIELQNISFEDIKKMKFKSLGLKKIDSSNIYRYESKPFKVLKFEISPCMDFLINQKDNELLIELNNLEIPEIKNIIDNLDLKIILRFYEDLKFCYVDRFISLKLIERKGIFKNLPEEIVTKLLSKTVELLSSRLDRKIKNRLKTLLEQNKSDFE